MKEKPVVKTGFFVAFQTVIALKKNIRVLMTEISVLMLRSTSLIAGMKNRQKGVNCIRFFHVGNKFSLSIVFLSFRARLLNRM